MGFISLITVFIYIVYLFRQLEGIHNDKMDPTDNHTIQLTITAFNLLKEAAFGTRNCVPDGNVTLYDKNLGHFKHLDSCCLRHFDCPQVARGDSGHNATNLGWFTSYKCDCEEDLMRCLKKKVTNARVESVTKEELRRIENFGRVYFNEYGIYARCFRYRPQPVCNTFYLWVNSYRCTEYTYLNGYGGPKMHFFHLPIWGDLPATAGHPMEKYPPYAALAPLAGPGSGDVQGAGGGGGGGEE